MTRISLTPPDLTGYQIRLPAFAGPLDALLQLIEREQLPIAEISLVAVTDQFLARFASLNDAPLDEVAAFAAVAGRLVLLKSRALLPRPPAAEPDPSEDDLVQHLLHHRALRDAIAGLGSRDAAGSASFPPGRVVLPPAAPLRLAPLPAGVLSRAIRRRLDRLAEVPTLSRLPPVVTVQECLDRIGRRLRLRTRLAFADLLPPHASRIDTLVTFLALLVLVRRSAVVVEQDATFGPILLRSSEAAAGAAIAAPSAAP